MKQIPYLGLLLCLSNIASGIRVFHKKLKINPNSNIATDKQSIELELQRKNNILNTDICPKTEPHENDNKKEAQKKIQHLKKIKDYAEFVNTLKTYL